MLFYPYPSPADGVAWGRLSDTAWAERFGALYAAAVKRAEDEAAADDGTT